MGNARHRRPRGRTPPAHKLGRAAALARRQAERDRLAQIRRLPAGHAARELVFPDVNTDRLGQAPTRTHTQECEDHRFMLHAATGDDAPCICGAQQLELGGEAA